MGNGNENGNENENGNGMSSYLTIQRRSAADSYVRRCQGRQASERSLVPCLWVEKASTRACQRQSRSLLLSDGPSTVNESFHPP